MSFKLLQLAAMWASLATATQNTQISSLLQCNNILVNFKHKISFLHQRQSKLNSPVNITTIVKIPPSLKASSITVAIGIITHGKRSSPQCQQI